MTTATIERRRQTTTPISCIRERTWAPVDMRDISFLSWQPTAPWSSRAAREEQRSADLPDRGSLAFLSLIIATQAGMLWMLFQSL